MAEGVGVIEVVGAIEVVTVAEAPCVHRVVDLAEVDSVAGAVGRSLSVQA